MSDEESVVRLENSARRAERDVVALVPKPLNWWEQQQLEYEQQENTDAEEDR